MKALMNKCTIFANKPTNIIFNENHTVINIVAHDNGHKVAKL
jgi:hypothetical protein